MCTIVSDKMSISGTQFCSDRGLKFLNSKSVLNNTWQNLFERCRLCIEKEKPFLLTCVPLPEPSKPLQPVEWRDTEHES